MHEYTFPLQKKSHGHKGYPGMGGYPGHSMGGYPGHGMGGYPGHSMGGYPGHGKSGGGGLLNKVMGAGAAIGGASMLANPVSCSRGRKD